jgi:tRNA 5-methylaminomethyl-2-thiouridine biosynthesis bifunctional protein
VVLANGIHAKHYSQTGELPLQAVRGQATYLESSSRTSSLACVVTGERSVFPALNGRHTVSASYRREVNLSPCAQDDLDNLAGMEKLFSDELIMTNSAVSSKVALRCNSNDFLPVIGAVANTERMKTSFADLKRNAQAPLGGTGNYYQGLYITTGHSSNGAATCPLAAEHIASLITGEPSPVSAEMITQLSPARFLIRDLKKQI